MRLFFALQLPERARQQIARSLLAAREAGGRTRFVPAEQLHFTLAFLGEQPAEALPQLCAAAEALRGAAPFELGIGGGGAFPGATRPRVLWLGVTRGAAELRALAEQLRAGLRERGFALEARVFRPHLTLARIRAGQERDARRALSALPADELVTLRAEAVALVQSTLDRTGAAHVPLRAWTLGA